MGGAAKTFRVRGIPSDWDGDRLKLFLQDQDATSNPTIRSLAKEFHHRSASATVDFQVIPSSLRNLPPDKTWDLPLARTLGMRSAYLSLDADFFGLTTLFVPPKEDHKADVIAISGLGGHAFGSFKQRGGEHMWLRDSLPYDLTPKITDPPMARVMTFGYDSRIVGSRSTQSLDDIASKLHDSLRSLADDSSIRPIIFIAHSLGGLVVKQVLIRLAESREEKGLKILKSVCGLALFGVPNHGMPIASLVPMAGNGPNRFLLESISDRNPQNLADQHERFLRALESARDTEIVCFYETLESPTAQEDEKGEWNRRGPDALLVSQTSATNCRRWEDGKEHIRAINRTHSDMVKFGPEDDNYEDVCRKLRDITQRAVTKRGKEGATQDSLPSHDNTNPSSELHPGSWFLVPYPRNETFIGREYALERLQQIPLKSTSQSRTSLFGLGGIGKTQIALEYAYWVQETCPDVSVFWVHGNNTDRFRESYTSIAQKCRTPGYNNSKEDVLPLVKRWLERKDQGPWLMVIDNADDTQCFFPSPKESNNANRGIQEQHLGQYVPECSHGSILITTRDKQLGLKLAKGKLLIQIDAMSDSESELLLSTNIGQLDIVNEDLLALARRLEHLPLALAQAAAYIVAKTIQVSDYLNLLNKSDDNLIGLLMEDFETVGRDSKTSHAVAETWTLSFEHIQRQDILASELFALMSFFDRQAIPMEFLDYYKQEGQERPTEIQLQQSLSILKAFSFVTAGQDRSLNIHRLVQLVSRKWLARAKRMKYFAGQALLAVSHAFPYGDHENWVTCSKYLPHAYQVQKHEGTGSRDERAGMASLRVCLAKYVYDQGQWKEAEGLQLKALEARKELFGPDHQDTLISMRELARTYSSQGRIGEAEELQVQVMEMTKIKLEAGHPDILRIMNNLAATYMRQSRFREAEELEIQVVETSKATLGLDHPDTLGPMINLASTYRKQSRLEEAEKLLVQVIETRETKLGADHPDTWRAMTNLASTYYKQGRLKEAEKLLVQAIDKMETKLGADHPVTLTSMDILAQI